MECSTEAVNINIVSITLGKTCVNAITYISILSLHAVDI